MPLPLDYQRTGFPSRGVEQGSDSLSIEDKLTILAPLNDPIQHGASARESSLMQGIDDSCRLVVSPTEVGYSTYDTIKAGCASFLGAFLPS
jgi:hypothetical protein